MQLLSDRLEIGKPKPDQLNSAQLKGVVSEKVKENSVQAQTMVHAPYDLEFQPKVRLSDRLKLGKPDQSNSAQLKGVVYEQIKENSAQSQIMGYDIANDPLYTTILKRRTQELSSTEHVLKNLSLAQKPHPHPDKPSVRALPNVEVDCDTNLNLG